MAELRISRCTSLHFTQGEINCEQKKERKKRREHKGKEKKRKQTGYKNRKKKKTVTLPSSLFLPLFPILLSLNLQFYQHISFTLLT